VAETAARRRILPWTSQAACQSRAERAPRHLQAEKLWGINAFKPDALPNRLAGRGPLAGGRTIAIWPINLQSSRCHEIKHGCGE